MNGMQMNAVHILLGICYELNGKKSSNNKNETRTHNRMTKCTQIDIENKELCTVSLGFLESQNKDINR